jgi:NAD-dependent deacetylase
MMEVAAEIASTADVFLVVGTSMVVYPAASLIDYVPTNVKKYIVDPGRPEIAHGSNLEFIQEKASTGMARVMEMLTTDK